jgi:hypothetical protein
MEKQVSAFFEWVEELKENETFGAVTNKISSPPGHGGDEPKATVWFETAPDELIAAINDGHVQIKDARRIEDVTPAYNRDEAAAAMEISPTDRFSPPS